MLQIIDNFLIKQNEKITQKKPSRFDKFFRSNFGKLFVAIVLIIYTGFHAYEKYEEKHYISCVAYLFVFSGMIILRIRHHVFNKNVHLSEATLLAFEGCLVAILASIRIFELIGEDAKLYRILLFAICSLLVIFMQYGLMARRNYLIHKGKMIDNNHN